MCQPVAGPFYRAAGMSYLRYANICADLMRSVLKEPLRAKAAQRQAIYFRSSTWTDGRQGPSVVTELKEVPLTK
ncbi:ATP synthase subunit epsilon [Scenedesmus sp. PABB004]|nr:ATP synthase subunit epsilon [Scenedesmus sp. PABB004]